MLFIIFTPVNFFVIFFRTPTTHLGTVNKRNIKYYFYNYRNWWHCVLIYRQYSTTLCNIKINVPFNLTAIPVYIQ